MSQRLAAKDPQDVKPYFIVWCDEDGTNDGSADDDGILQSETISTAVWTVPTGITKDSQNEDAVTIKGVAYGANVATTIWLSGGTAGDEYRLTCHVTLTDGRELDASIIVPMRPR